MRKTFRELLNQEGPVFGSFLQFYSPEVVEMMAAAGMQYVIFDQEHGQLTDEQVGNLIRAADTVGIATQVRLPEIREDLIKHALDMGAGSLKVPGVNSAEQAKQLVRYAKYAPIGERGACPYVRANQWGTGDLSTYYAQANAETVLAVIVESPDGIANIEDIICVDGIDVVGVGKVDLAVALGLPGQIDHPKVHEAQEKLAELCYKHGKFCGSSFNDPKDAVRFRDMPGMKYFNAPSVQRVLCPFYRQWTEEARKNLQ